MKKIKIISILILIVISAYFTWNYIEFKNSQINTLERENVSQLAIKTIESIYLGDVEVINSISRADKVKNTSFNRMKALNKSTYSDIEIMDIQFQKGNICTIAVVVSNDIYRYSEYILKFKKIHNKWMLVDLKTG